MTKKHKPPNRSFKMTTPSPTRIDPPPLGDIYEPDDDDDDTGPEHLPWLLYLELRDQLLDTMKQLIAVTAPFQNKVKPGDLVGLAKQIEIGTVPWANAMLGIIEEKPINDVFPDGRLVTYPLTAKQFCYLLSLAANGRELRCIALTQNGKPCKRLCAPGEDICAMHRKSLDAGKTVYRSAGSRCEECDLTVPPREEDDQFYCPRCYSIVAAPTKEKLV